MPDFPRIANLVSFNSIIYFCYQFCLWTSASILYVRKNHVFKYECPLNLVDQSSSFLIVRSNLFNLCGDVIYCLFFFVVPVYRDGTFTLYSPIYPHEAQKVKCETKVNNKKFSSHNGVRSNLFNLYGDVIYCLFFCCSYIWEWHIYTVFSNISS